MFGAHVCEQYVSMGMTYPTYAFSFVSVLHDLEIFRLMLYVCMYVCMYLCKTLLLFVRTEY